MILKHYTPPHPLRAFVKSLLYYQGYTTSRAYEKLLPDGEARLIIELDGNVRVRKNNKQQDDAYKTAWITGIQTKPVIYRAEKNATTLVIQFEAGGLFALLDIPATEFHDTFVEATLVLPQVIVSLRERLLNCTETSEIFAITIHFLEKQILQKTAEKKILAFIKHTLCFKGASLAEISREAGYSQKQLIHIFKKHVGLSPKKYQRLHRFNQSLALLNIPEQPEYSTVSLHCNYYDQAHFINEFRTFSHYTPHQYRLMQRDYPHVIPLDNCW